MKILLIFDDMDTKQKNETLLLSENLRSQNFNVVYQSVQEHLSFKANIKFDEIDLIGFALSKNVTNEKTKLENLLSIIRGPIDRKPCFYYTGDAETENVAKLNKRLADMNLYSIAYLNKSELSVAVTVLAKRIIVALDSFSNMDYKVSSNGSGFAYCKVFPHNKNRRFMDAFINKSNGIDKKCQNCEMCLSESRKSFNKQVNCTDC